MSCRLGAVGHDGANVTSLTSGSTASALTVGVVVPAKDAASTLPATLASLAAQQRPPQRVVVVDDGSADDTADVARSWGDHLPIVVRHHEHTKGLAAARRTAIETLNTDVVALVDADDVVLPDHLGTMLDSYTSSRSLVIARLIRWVPGRGLRVLDAPKGLPEGDRLLATLLTRNVLVVGSLFSREFYDRVGGFRDGFLGCEDWDLWIRMVRAGAHVTRPGHPTMVYRVSDVSLSGRGLLASEIGVVSTAVTESTRGWERKAAQHGLRRLRAQQSLADAYAAARAGRPWTSRAHAVRATRGEWAVRVRAGALLVAPKRTVIARDRRRSDTTAWLRP
jgi:hypothetical protein